MLLCIKIYNFFFSFLAIYPYRLEKKHFKIVIMGLSRNIENRKYIFLDNHLLIIFVLNQPFPETKTWISFEIFSFSRFKFLHLISRHSLSSTMLDWIFSKLALWLFFSDSRSCKLFSRISLKICKILVECTVDNRLFVYSIFWIELLYYQLKLFNLKL